MFTYQNFIALFGDGLYSPSSLQFINTFYVLYNLRFTIVDMTNLRTLPLQKFNII